MQKTELIELVHSEAGVSKADAGTAVNVIFDNIVKALQRGEQVSLTGFGTFSKSHRAARKGRNPATGQEIMIAASCVAKFKPGKALRDAIQEEA